MAQLVALMSGVVLGGVAEVVGSKAMMFVKLYFRTSDIYLISLVSLDPSGFHLRTKKMPSIEKKELIYDVYCASVVINISAEHPFWGMAR